MRDRVFSWVRYMTLMYCWVMVDPPTVCSGPTKDRAARASATTSKPGSVQKVRFSAATIASFTCGFISSKSIETRFCTENEPSWVLLSA